MTVYCGLFVALWMIETARAAGWKRWLLCGTWTTIVAVALSAVELLPTIGAARLATRWGGTVEQHPLFDTRNILQLFGPFLGKMRHEPQSGVGVLELALAGLALWLSPRRARWPALVFVLLAAFSFGGGAVLGRLPGLSLFRLPTRMMQLAAFPLALLAGIAVDALAAGPRWIPALRRRCLIWLATLSIVGAGLVLLGGWFTQEMGRVVPYVASLAVTLGVLAWILAIVRSPAPQWKSVLLVGLVLTDTWMLACGLVAVRPESEIYATSRGVQYLEEHRLPRGRILDRDWTPGSSTSPLGTGTPLALLHGLEVVRGYEPLDVQRYKEFLQLVTGRDGPLRADDPSTRNFTMPALTDFEIKELALLDLLGVRYVLQPASAEPASAAWEKVLEDESPLAYEMSGKETAGIHELPPYVVYRNPNAFRRAFVVFESSPLPERSRVLAAMKQTDFHRQVLLEDSALALERGPTKAKAERAVAITTYEPDKVVIQVHDGPPGWLLLTDAWYPGWSCTVDGEAIPVHRADFLFRAVAVPPGAQEVVFTLALPGYRLGKRISAFALAGTLALGLSSLAWPRLRGRSAKLS